MTSDERLVADWPLALGFESRFVEARDGTRLRVVEGGPPQGRRVVLLHGAPQLSYEWRHVMRALARSHRVIAPDLRGYGGSDLARSGRYDLDVLVDDLRLVIEATRPPAAFQPADPDRVVIVAHDWGGPIAWRFAETWPATVRHLVAANAPHPAAYALELTNPKQAARSWYIALFQVPGVERLIERADAGPLLWMMTRSAPAGLFSDDDLAIYRAALRRPGRVEAVLAYYRQAFRPPPGEAPRGGAIRWVAEQREAMMASGRVAAPTTILWGEADKALAPSHPLATRRWASHLEVRTLPDASHWLPEERPDDVVQAVLDGDAAG